MAKVVIESIKSVNGLPFLSTREETRKVFGDNYEEYKEGDGFKEPEVKNIFFKVMGMMSEMEGRSVDEMLADIPGLPKSIEDSYGAFRIEYNEKLQFRSIEFFTDEDTELIVDGIDCSDFSVEKLLKLADDFVCDDDGYTSHSKQIGIWCPNDKNKAETVLFGCKDYYDIPEVNWIPLDEIINPK